MNDSCFYNQLKKNFKKKRTEDIIESPISSMQYINTKNVIPVYGILEIIRTIYKKGIIRDGPEPICKKTINVNPFKANGIYRCYQLIQSISVLRVVGWYFTFLFKF